MSQCRDSVAVCDVNTFFPLSVVWLGLGLSAAAAGKNETWACSNETCNGELEWSDGTPFAYNTAYMKEVVVHLRKSHSHPAIVLSKQGGIFSVRKKQQRLVICQCPTGESGVDLFTILLVGSSITSANPGISNKALFLKCIKKYYIVYF